MNAKYKHTEQDYRLAVKKSSNFSQMCRELGIVPAGGNIATVKRKITEFKIDISHFDGKPSIAMRYSDTPICKTAIKNKLLRERGHKCQVSECGLTEWLGKKITLELEHIDGDNSNDSEDNLLLLCPNCHAQTKTWRRKKEQIAIQHYYCDCGNTKQKRSKTCNTCYRNRFNDKIIK